jgi:hypothetical protein
VGRGDKVSARTRASALADKPSGKNGNDCEDGLECGDEEEGRFASGSPDCGCCCPLRCAESLWVAPRCVRMNGVSIAALEGLEDTRLLYLQIRRFHNTKAMTPATSNRVATPPMMAFLIMLTCDDFDSIVLKLMFCTGILCYKEIS